MHYIAKTKIKELQPSLMNFCVTDGESVVVTRYVSSRTDEAASLVSGEELMNGDFLSYMEPVVLVWDNLQRRW